MFHWSVPHFCPQKVENGVFIPMIDQFRKIKQGKILLEIELIEKEREELEKRHKEGYLLKPVIPGEFSDWEDEQVWVE
jgi:hypothetical protein